MSNSIEVRQPDAVEMEAVRALRYNVLDQPLGIPRKLEPSKGDALPGAIHVAAFDGNRVVSTVRVEPYEMAQYLVRRMATDPEYQGQGIGALVLAAAEVRAHEQGAASMILHSRSTAIGFYEKQGYNRTGNIHLCDGDENIEMVKTL